VLAVWNHVRIHVHVYMFQLNYFLKPLLNAYDFYPTVNLLIPGSIWKWFS
jgi:hypothetical protein